MLGANNKLEGLVIEILSQHPVLSADALETHIAGRSRPFTIQAIYQELRKLERTGIVVRKRGLYSLRLLWLFETAEKFTHAYENFLKSNAMANELPSRNEKKRWSFFRLRQLLDLWTELTFVIVPLVKPERRTLLECVEHVWFHTANPVNETHFLRAMKRERVDYVLVCRGNSYLDKSYREMVEKLGGLASFGATSFPGKENSYLSLLGDYIIDVKISPPLAAQVGEFYGATKRAADLSPQALLHFAAASGRCSLEVTLDPERARRERKKFEQYFNKTF